MALEQGQSLILRHDLISPFFVTTHVGNRELLDGIAARTNRHESTRYCLPQTNPGQRIHTPLPVSAYRQMHPLSIFVSLACLFGTHLA